MFYILFHYQVFVDAKYKVWYSFLRTRVLAPKELFAVGYLVKFQMKLMDIACLNARKQSASNAARIAVKQHVNSLVQYFVIWESQICIGIAIWSMYFRNHNVSKLYNFRHKLMYIDDI